MIRMKSALVLAYLLLDITSYIEIAQTQIEPSRQLPFQQEKPPVPGRPPEREPAGTRGPCEETKTPFTPLLPVTSTETKFSGFTLTGHPTFWFYVPYQASSVSSGKFSLEDRQGNPVYETSFKLPNTPGFISVSIPQAILLEKLGGCICC